MWDQMQNVVEPNQEKKSGLLAGRDDQACGTEVRCGFKGRCFNLEVAGEVAS
jgi:hypothetical protein